MAIVRMKKLNVLAARSQKEALLRELIMLGCVELRDQEYLLDDPETAQAISREFSNAVEWQGKKNQMETALKLLDRYVPKKTPMLAPKPELGKLTFLDDSELEEAGKKAAEIVSLDERIRNCSAEEIRQSLIVEGLSPWKSLDLPLETTGTKNVAITLGTVSAATDLGALSNALSASVEETQIFEVNSDENLHYLCVFYLREAGESVMQILRDYGFAAPAFGSVSGTAAENISALESALEKIRLESSVCRAQMETHSEDREFLKKCIDRVGTHVARDEAAELLMRTESAILLEGWCAAPQEEELTAILERYDCAYELSDPTEEEYPEVPVELKNNKLTDGLNMVTNMYSLPQYGSVDPNPLMAPFFILFYGIMMADMGYGLIMVLAGLLITLKMRPKEGFLKYFGELMIEGGIATFIMGIFTGGLFGDAPKWIVQLINPESTWEGLPALIDPLNDTVTVLIGAMILGFIHLLTGMVISFVMKKRSGDLVGALCEEGAMWLVFIGAGLTVLGIGKVGGVPVPLIIGLAAYCIGKMRGGKGIGRIIAIFSGIYSDATGWFGDILSYARLMALMLAGSVIAQVFNTLGAMPGNLIVFLIISILGNALNFGLNLLGCYVHDLRLQCLEFFNKFYVAGGKPFAPLKIRSKYYDVSNN